MKMNLYTIQREKRYNGGKIQQHEAVWSYADIREFIDDKLTEYDCGEYIEAIQNSIDWNFDSESFMFKVGNMHDYDNIEIIFENKNEMLEIMELLKDMIINRLKDEILILSDGEIDL